jgi:hypothetical protein
MRRRISRKPDPARMLQSDLLARFDYPFCALAVAVDFDDGAVDHGELHVGIVQTALSVTRRRGPLGCQHSTIQYPAAGDHDVGSTEWRSVLLQSHLPYSQAWPGRKVSRFCGDTKLAINDLLTVPMHLFQRQGTGISPDGVPACAPSPKPPPRRGVFGRRPPQSAAGRSAAATVLAAAPRRRFPNGP